MQSPRDETATPKPYPPNGAQHPSHRTESMPARDPGATRSGDAWCVDSIVVRMRQLHIYGRQRASLHISRPDKALTALPASRRRDKVMAR